MNTRVNNAENFQTINIYHKKLNMKYFSVVFDHRLEMARVFKAISWNQNVTFFSLSVF